VLAVPFAYMLAHVLFFVEPRFLIPMLPYLSIVAAAGILGWPAAGQPAADRSEHSGRPGEGSAT